MVGGTLMENLHSLVENIRRIPPQARDLAYYRQVRHNRLEHRAIFNRRSQRYHIAIGGLPLVNMDIIFMITWQPSLSALIINKATSGVNEAQVIAWFDDESDCDRMVHRLNRSLIFGRVLHASKGRLNRPFDT